MFYKIFKEYATINIPKTMVKIIWNLNFKLILNLELSNKANIVKAICFPLGGI